MVEPLGERSARPDFKNFVISPPVRRAMEEEERKGQPAGIRVIITFCESRDHPDEGIQPAKEAVRRYLEGLRIPVKESDFFLFAQLLPDRIRDLAEKREWVYQIWTDERCYAHLLHSTETVKATASWRTFEARGKGITWAVLDTGIRADHPHFTTFGTINRDLSRDFSDSEAPEGADSRGAALDDKNGHGTHVAGIIAGAPPPRSDQQPYKAAMLHEGRDDPDVTDLPACPSGVAPLATLVSVKVLDDTGMGSASSAILALEYLRKVNDASRSVKIDGVNMSLGYPFDPQWYGCGHSPLCEEVTRAVDSGLVVVISCGNAGYGNATLASGQVVPVWMNLSITDPANAEGAIAVGSVHKSAPHRYGISYFSSKGPTGDGRKKPDLVAPGEKVISCAVELEKGYAYKEGSGTSVAAPHVSGAIAAFLSCHPEFRADPRKIKEIFMSTATDLGRDPAFQGKGLVDLLRALMSV